MFDRILVAVDGSGHAGKAVDVAIELAKHFGSQLVAVSVYKHHSPLESSLSLVQTREIPEPPDETLRDLANDAVAWARQRAEAAGLEDIETVVRRGPPSRTIVNIAKEKNADAVVLGSRGLGDVEGFFLGSVSHKVNALTECTCITVK